MKALLILIAVCIVGGMLSVSLAHGQVASPYELKKQKAWQAFTDFCAVIDAPPPQTDKMREAFANDQLHGAR